MVDSSWKIADLASSLQLRYEFAPLELLYYTPQLLQQSHSVENFHDRLRLLQPDSLTEFAWVTVNNSIVIVGGTTEKHPSSDQNDGLNCKSV
ncbi:hypothetical protein FRX31_032010 [Thalictrum thalictroides]|uniref:Uncharacterized protein n=1 Tax=Thalictrum thalictroides TaxID=46969 RepID=A0A7J6V0F2_THATH|nr:hypothetical protein FRX31_032010 [Thalictrum thalictroides]